MAPPLKEKREEVKEGRRRDGRGREGKERVHERHMLCVAAAGLIWPS